MIDHATYEKPAEYWSGFRLVLANGVPVVQDGALVTGAFPGQAARAPVRQ